LLVLGYDFGYQEARMARKKGTSTKVKQQSTRPRKTRRGPVVFTLLGVALLQIIMTYGTLDLPLLDTRLHYNYDNAWFTFFARNGNRNADLRSQFGVTDNRYEAWGVQRAKPAYYTDHPFLVKAAFQQYCRVFGHGEWSGRSFYLLVSFGIAAGVFLLLLRATRRLLAALIGAVFLVSIPLFATFQTCVKFELDGMLLGTWQLVVLSMALETPTRARLLLFGVLNALAVMTHWTSGLCAAFSVGLILVLFLRNRTAGLKKTALAGIVGGIVGFCLLLALFSFVKGDWSGAQHALTSSFERRTDATAIDLGSYVQRQWTYARTNFSTPLLVGIGLISAIWAIRGFGGRSVPTKEPRADIDQTLWIAIASTLATACVWQFVFLQGSFIHVYWQLWFTLPVAMLLGATTILSSEGRGTRRAWIGAVVIGVLFLSSAARDNRDEIIASQLGKEGDIRFLKSLRDDPFSRFVFLPVSNHELNVWFTGPLFEYYTDRPVRISGAGEKIANDEKVLILKYPQQEQLVAAVEKQAGCALVNEKCGPRFCAYDVIVHADQEESDGRPG
jgi:hypothetical protein